MFRFPTEHGRTEVTEGRWDHAVYEEIEGSKLLQRCLPVLFETDPASTV